VLLAATRQPNERASDGLRSLGNGHDHGLGLGLTQGQSRRLGRAPNIDSPGNPDSIRCMGRKKRKKPRSESRPEPQWLVNLTGFVVFASQVAVLPGGYSPFRQPKISVAVAGLALLTGFFFATRLWRDSLSLRLGRLGICLMTLPGLQVLSMLWAPSPRLALQTAATTAVIAAAALMIALWPPGAQRRVLQWAVAGATVSALVLVAQVSGLKLVENPNNVHSDRLHLTGLAGNPSDLAMACVLLLPLLLPAALAGKRRVRPWVVPVFFAAASLAGQSFTAAAAIGLLGIGVLVFLSDRRAWVAAGLIVCIAVAAIMASPWRTRLDRQMNRLRHGNWYGLLSAREDGWTAAAAMVKSSPLTGVGSGQYSREFYPARLAWLDHHDDVGHRGEIATHFEWTHNDPLQLAAELGLLGVVWMAAFGYALARRPDRWSPPVVLGVLAWTPFLLLHYPTHLAVGVIPAMLILAQLIASNREQPVALLGRFSRRVAAVALAAFAVLIVIGCFETIRLDQWRGIAEEGLAAAENAQGSQRAQLLQAVESRSVRMTARHAAAAPWLWRLAGRARLLAGAFPEAEQAFRRANALSPHEEAEMGLGLALAGQGRTSEAVHHLTRACRLNPRLTLLIRQDALRSAVQRSLGVDDQGRPRRS